MNSQTHLIHSNTVQKLLRDHFGLENVTILRVEERIQSINYIVSNNGALYYVKCAKNHSDNLYNLILRVSKSVSLGTSVYSPKILEPKDSVSFELDGVTYHVYVTEYINGLTKYKDMSLRHLDVDLLSSVEELHKILNTFKEDVLANSSPSQVFNDRYILVSSNFDLLSLDLSVDQYNSIDKALHIVSKENFINAVVHGYLGNNMLLDQNMKTVVLDFDDIAIGSKLEDLSRSLASLESEDIGYYLKQFKDSSSSDEFAKLCAFTLFSLLFEVVECKIKFSLFSNLVGENETKSWIDKKTNRLVTFLSNEEIL